MNKEITIKIKNLKQYGHSGWEWTESVFMGNLELQVPRQCRTNRVGTGLWYGNTQKGTCQFSLGETYNTAYNKIKRELIKEFEYYIT